MCASSSRPDRLIRAPKKRRAANFIQEVASLDDGDLVVHVDHGIGRYDGLLTLEVGGAPHDMLRVLYAGGDKLFVPVENIEVLSRFGSEDAGVQLDKLGGVAWQGRKAKVRQRILEHIKPDFVHVFVDGRIVEEGGPELAHVLEADGYERYGAVS